MRTEYTEVDPMTTSHDNQAPLRRISDIRAEEVAAHIREARRLRSIAMGELLLGLGRTLVRPFQRASHRRGGASAPHKPAIG